MNGFRKPPLLTIFLDASVLIAALLSRTGGSFRLCRESSEGRIRLVTNRYAHDEVVEVLTRKYPERVAFIAGFFAWSKIAIRRNPSTDAVRSVLPLIHPEDAPILAGALRVRAAFLLSLDRKDFFTETLRNARLPLHIVTPQEFFQKYRNTSFSTG